MSTHFLLMRFSKTVTNAILKIIVHIFQFYFETADIDFFLFSLGFQRDENVNKPNFI